MIPRDPPVVRAPLLLHRDRQALRRGADAFRAGRDDLLAAPRERIAVEFPDLAIERNPTFLDFGRRTGENRQS